MAETRVLAQTGSHRAGDSVRVARNEPALRDAGLTAANFKTQQSGKTIFGVMQTGRSRGMIQVTHTRRPREGPWRWL